MQIESCSNHEPHGKVGVTTEVKVLQKKCNNVWYYLYTIFLTYFWFWIVNTVDWQEIQSLIYALYMCTQAFV